MPTLRAFRALRYDNGDATDLSSLICPPYDVIPPEQRELLAARDPRNAVHVELPEEVPGDPDARYREAARRFVRWRSDGTLRKDRAPCVYVYEQSYTVPGSGVKRVQRGFFARMKLEPFAPDGGVRPHERTMSGPKEDRLRLLRACGANLSPVVALYKTDGRSTASILRALTERRANADAHDGDGVRHRLWVCPVEDAGGGAVVRELLTLASSPAATIADGHHRYETALRYREERGVHRACESDPAYDYVLCLLYDIAATELTILATHRVVTGGPSGEELLAAADALFDIERCASSAELLARFSDVGEVVDPDEAGPDLGSGRFGVWTAGVGAVLRARRGAFDGVGSSGGGRSVRKLDVVALAAALERLLGIDADAAAAGHRLSYTKSAAEAVAQVEGGAADTAFLLDPTPVRAVIRVAAEGDVIPQKSTYFYPKAATGFVFNPLES